MTITVVSAVALGGVIGDAERIPWNLPGDLRQFRRITWGHPMIMGRRTFESIGRPLPGRSTVVITRNPNFQHGGCAVVAAWDEALAKAAALPGGDEVMVVGGETIYRLAVPTCQRLHLTRVNGTFHGKTLFPIDQARERRWWIVERKTHAPDAAHRYGRDYMHLTSTQPGLGSSYSEIASEWWDSFYFGKR